MKNILTIIKKEIDRVLRDKRLILTVMILPGLMLFIVYSFIGNAVQNIGSGSDVSIAIVNPQPDFTTIYAENEDIDNLNIITIQLSEVPHYKDLIDNEDWSLLIVFGEDFAGYNNVGDKPLVTIYSNQNNMNSSAVASRFMNYLLTYQRELSFELYGNTNYFQLNQDGTEVSQEAMTGMLMSTLLPMLVIMFLFAGAMSVGPESIAGEKERGTIATLLVTPVKRSQIALGKVISLSILAMLSAISSFIGIALSLPKLLSLDNASLGIYSFSDYVMILGLLFTTVIVIVGVISIISAFSKTLKEANSYITPIYILTIVVSLSSMFGNGANTNLFMYALPIYNSVQTLIAIMMFDKMASTYLLITVITNLTYAAILIYLLNRMFNSEKYMFSK